MKRSYFIIEKGIIERDDLSIYEKMCCVVLAKWASEETVSFDMKTLANQMSCTENKASETIAKLKQKGFIESESKDEIMVQTPKIIKAEDVQGLSPVQFKEENDQGLTKEDLLEAVRTLIEEPLNDSEAKIILNFANDDLGKIKFCYKKAKNMQVGDKIEALMMELQRKEKSLALLPVGDELLESPVASDPQEIQEDTLDKEKTIEDHLNEVVPEDKPWYLDDDDTIDEVLKPSSGNQINTGMINKMRAYKKYGK